jgi:glycogen debranching enzyme
MVPNLLGEGKVSRYNCRDATWFWLHSIKDIFCHGVTDILKKEISVGFANDDAEFDIQNGKLETIGNILQSGLV